MKEHLIQLLTDAVATLQADGSLPADITPVVMMERTRDRAHGDFASNLAMTLAKPARRKPRDIAEQLLAVIKTGGQLQKVEIAGPGFINFFLGPEAGMPASMRFSNRVSSLDAASSARDPASR